MNPLSTFSDSDLLLQLQSGSRRAFSELYERYWRKLFYAAASRLDQVEEAEEIVQDIFISLWERREELDIRTTLEVYLAVSVKYRVIKTLARQRVRRRFLELNVADILHDPTNEWFEFEELRARLEALVATLPEKCRLVYNLSRESGYTQKQIAQEFSISEKTVEAHISKALRILREGLNAMLL